MSRDIFQFWSEMPENSYVHPEDQPVLDRCAHNFELGCCAGPYAGPLRTASVVFLFLSPGLDNDDVKHCASEDGKLYYAKQRSGIYELPDEATRPPAFKWLNKIINQFGIDYEQARTTVAMLNIAAYKSKDYKDWSMLAALPSSRICLDWAQSVLFPQAERGERVVVCLRSRKYWGLGENQSTGSLFAPLHNRNAMTHRGYVRTAVTEAVQRAVLQRRVIAQ
jgi:hypothetical protein